MDSLAIPQHPVSTTDKPFSSLGLSAPILGIIEKIGCQNPTPIQAEVIPLALEGKDIIGLAQTGSGKTAAFSLPLADRLTHGRGVRGLILSPTREIALQTKAFLDVFGVNHDLNTARVTGGLEANSQTDAPGSEPRHNVATPRRLLRHLR